jgi:hypothetical protein
MVRGDQENSKSESSSVRRESQSRRLGSTKVRDRNPNNGGYWLEAVYVVAHGQTFSIDFSGEAGGPTLEPLKNTKSIWTL